jgi:hypothetical protein
LGIGDWGLGPIPNPQSPIPNPQSPSPKIIFKIINIFNIFYYFNYKKRTSLKFNNKKYIINK